MKFCHLTTAFRRLNFTEALTNFGQNSIIYDDVQTYAGNTTCSNAEEKQN